MSSKQTALRVASVVFALGVTGVLVVRATSCTSTKPDGATPASTEPAGPNSAAPPAVPEPASMSDTGSGAPSFPSPSAPADAGPGASSSSSNALTPSRPDFLPATKAAMPIIREEQAQNPPPQAQQPNTP